MFSLIGRILGKPHKRSEKKDKTSEYVADWRHAAEEGGTGGLKWG